MLPGRLPRDGTDASATRAEPVVPDDLGVGGLLVPIQRGAAAPEDPRTRRRVVGVNPGAQRQPRGTVVAAGPGKKDEPVTVKVGDTVLYGKYAGTEISIEGSDYLIMRESDILAIV